MGVVGVFSFFSLPLFSPFGTGVREGLGRISVLGFESARNRNLGGGSEKRRELGKEKEVRIFSFPACYKFFWVEVDSPHTPLGNSRHAIHAIPPKYFFYASK